jgi:hypothetical protein
LVDIGLLPVAIVVPVGEFGTTATFLLVADASSNEEVQKLMGESITLLLKHSRGVSFFEAVFFGTGQFGVVHVFA